MTITRELTLALNQFTQACGMKGVRTHGTQSCYRGGCRCVPCRQAKQDSSRKPVEEDVALTGGVWVPRDGIMRWEKAGEHVSANRNGGPTPVPMLFPQDERRDAHRRYWLGERSPSVVAGEREYQRDAKRRARAARRAMESDAA